MVKPLPEPTLTPKQCWELPRCPNSPSKPVPRSRDKAGDTRGHQCPPELRAWPGPVTSNQCPKNSSFVPGAEGRPGLTQSPSQEGNVELRGLQGVPVPVTATQEPKFRTLPLLPAAKPPGKNQATPRPPSGDTARDKTPHDVPRDAGISLPPDPSLPKDPRRAFHSQIPAENPTSGTSPQSQDPAWLWGRGTVPARRGSPDDFRVKFWDPARSQPFPCSHPLNSHRGARPKTQEEPSWHLRPARRLLPFGWHRINPARHLSKPRAKGRKSHLAGAAKSSRHFFLTSPGVIAPTRAHGDGRRVQPPQNPADPVPREGLAHLDARLEPCRGEQGEEK